MEEWAQIFVSLAPGLTLLLTTALSVCRLLSQVEFLTFSYEIIIMKVGRAVEQIVWDDDLKISGPLCSLVILVEDYGTHFFSDFEVNKYLSETNNCIHFKMAVCGKLSF